jgi:hypothetical protein
LHQYSNLIIITTLMLFPFTALIVRMTFQTGEFSYRSRVTGTAGCAAMIDASAFFINARLGV